MTKTNYNKMFKLAMRKYDPFFRSIWPTKRMLNVGCNCQPV